MLYLVDLRLGFPKCNPNYTILITCSCWQEVGNGWSQGYKASTGKKGVFPSSYVAINNPLGMKTLACLFNSPLGIKTLA